jgi:hypothetical protein
VVSNVIVPLCKAYGIIDRVRGDNYAGNYPQELCRKVGYQYEVWTKHKSDLYRDMLPAITSRQITFPRHDRLTNQTCTLERSVKRSGRDEITHPVHGHDDIVNAVAGALAVTLRQAAAEEYQRIPIVMPGVINADGSITTPSGRPLGGGAKWIWRRRFKRVEKLRPRRRLDQRHAAHGRLAVVMTNADVDRRQVAARHVFEAQKTFLPFNSTATAGLNPRT